MGMNEYLYGNQVWLMKLDGDYNMLRDLNAHNVGTANRNHLPIQVADSIDCGLRVIELGNQSEGTSFSGQDLLPSAEVIVGSQELAEASLKSVAVE